MPSESLNTRCGTPGLDPVKSKQPVSASPNSKVADRTTDSEPESTQAEGPSASKIGSDAPRKRKRKRKPKSSAPGVDQPVAGREETSSSQHAGTGDSTRKRTRRRRKSKARDKTTQATNSKADATATKPPPFQHLFAPSPKGKADAVREPQARVFKKGNLVAGHVVFAGAGAAIINLYGKGIAFVRENEPREIPALHRKVLAEPPRSEAYGLSKQPQPTLDESVEPEGFGAPETGDGEIRPKSTLDESGEAESLGAAQTGMDIGDGEIRPQPTLDERGEAASLGAPKTGTNIGDGEREARPCAGTPPVQAEPPSLKIGQFFRGRVGAVSESGHVALVNRTIDVSAVREQLRKAKNTRERVSGLVFGYNRGGFDVLVEGIRAYCPVGGLSLTPVDNPSLYLGRVMPFQVQAVRPGRQGVVVSRQFLLEREAKKATKQRLRALNVGDVVEGTVTRVFDFGLIIDLGCRVEGILHHSELSYTHGVRASQVAKVGDTLEVKVIELNIGAKRKAKAEADANAGQPAKKRATIALSLRALQPDPWQQHAELLRPGKVVRGKIVSTKEFGVFVELAPSVEGLLHVSEFASPGGEPLTDAKDAVSVGDEVVVVVERIDNKRRRVSLTLLDPLLLAAFEAGTLDDSGSGKNVRVGSCAKVVVHSSDAKGVCVRVAGILGRRGRGFIRPADTGTRRGTDLREQFPPGTELEVKVIATAQDGSLRCSLKALAVDEQRRVLKAIHKKSNRKVFGTLGDLLRGKLGKD